MVGTFSSATGKNAVLGRGIDDPFPHPRRRIKIEGENKMLAPGQKEQPWTTRRENGKTGETVKRGQEFPHTVTRFIL